MIYKRTYEVEKKQDLYYDDKTKYQATKKSSISFPCLFSGSILCCIMYLYNIYNKQRPKGREKKSKVYTKIYPKSIYTMITIFFFTENLFLNSLYSLVRKSIGRSVSR